MTSIVAILVNGDRALEQTLNPPFNRRLHMQFAENWPSSVREVI